MPLVPERPPVPSFPEEVERAELEEQRLAKGRQVTDYYVKLDVNDPANQPTDDETKTIPPFHTMIKEDADE